MTLILDSLEQAITTIQTARHSVKWISADNLVWMTLLHAEQYLAEQFKEEFNQLFQYDTKETE